MKDHQRVKFYWLLEWSKPIIGPIFIACNIKPFATFDENFFNLPELNKRYIVIRLCI